MRAATIWATLGLWLQSRVFSVKLRAKVANFPEERTAPSYWKKLKKTYFVLIFVN